MNLSNLNLLTKLRYPIVFHRGVKHKFVPQFKPPKAWTNGKKFDGFTYYPRYPNEVDPPIEPSKLLMVQRIKPYKGNWNKLKKILTKIGLGEDEKMTKVTIVKNLPETNKELWQIKHLIKITPVKFMNGEPTLEDLNYCQLNEWGEFTITKPVISSDSKLIEETEKFINDPKHLDSDTKKKHFRLQWLNPYI